MHSSKWLWGWLVAGLAWWLCASSPAVAAGGTSRADSLRAPAMPGVVVVKFKAGAAPPGGAGKTGSAVFDKAAAKYAVTSVTPTFAALGAAAGKQAAALQQIYDVTYAGAASPAEVAAALARDPNVAYAEPRFIYTYDGQLGPAAASPARLATGPAEMPNDPLLYYMPYVDRLGLAGAWGTVKAQGDVLIAIVDGGTDWRHPDLAPNVWTNTGEVPGNGFDDDGNGYVDDVHGWNFATRSADPTGLPATPTNAQHGTATAGIAAAATDNGLGMAGTSWNARFMALNVGCPTRDRGVCFGYEGIVYAVANGAQIVNASWGGPGFSQLGADVIAYARARGVLVVAAAGNSGIDNDVLAFYPASYEGVLSVGATNRDNDVVAGFSNYGRTIDLFAPGVQMAATLPGAEYTNGANGTSFSAPFVAGLAALLWKHNPTWTPDQVGAQLRATSDLIDADNPDIAGRMGHGRVNVGAALSASVPGVEVTSVSISDSDGDGVLERGETVVLRVRLKNYLAATSALTVQLVAEVPKVYVEGGLVNLAGLPTGGEAEAVYTVRLDPATPDEYEVRLAFYVMAPGYRDGTTISLYANPPQVVLHDTGTLRLSLISQGNLGWSSFRGSFGSGFVFGGQDRLFEGGLLVARAADRVSDNVRDGSGDTVKDDFRRQPDTPFDVQPGTVTAQHGRLTLRDELAAKPLGIEVKQDTYADTRAENSGFVLVKYTLRSHYGGIVENVHTGLFFDWDVREDANDFSAYDAERRLGYVADAPEGAVLVGTKLLTTQAPVHYRGINAVTQLYNGFTDAEKWSFLTGGVQGTDVGGTDVATLLGAGPFTVSADCPVEVAYALVTGSTRDDLLRNANAAQAFWEANLSTFSGNRPPAFAAATAALSVAEGDTLRHTFAATDPDGCARLRYSLAGAPAGASIDAATGAFAFAPGYDQAGELAFSVVVTDGSLADTVRVTVTVANTNRAPRFTATLGNRQMAEGETLSFTFQAADPDGETLTYALVAPPPGASIDAATGAFTFKPGFGQAGLHVIVAVVRDGALADTARATVTVSTTNRKPHFTSLLGTPTVAEGDTLSFTFRAADPDGGTLTFALAERPRGASIDAATGTFTFTPDYDQAGEHPLAVVVTDGALADTARTTITVTNTNRRPAFAAAPASLALAEGETLVLDLEATDPDGDALTFRLEAPPRGAALEAATGRLTFAPDFTQAGQHVFIVFATDGALEAEQRFSVRVANTNRAPAFTATLAPQTMAEGEVLTFTYTAADPDGDALAFRLLDAVAGATLEAATGRFRFAPGYDQAGTYTFSVAVGDGEREVVTATQIVVTEANRPPAFTAALGDRSIREGEALSFTFAAADPDGQGVRFALVEGPRGATLEAATGRFAFTPDFTQAGHYAVAVAATDGVLADTARATLTVVNVNRRPAFTATMADTTLFEGQAVAFTFKAADADAEPLTFALVNAPAGAAIEAATGAFTFRPGAGQAGAYTFTVIATDGADADTTRARVTVQASTYALEAAYPNPAPPGLVTFGYRLPYEASVRLEVYDVLGRRVRVLVDERRPVGPHTVRWDGRDQQGRPLASGLYVYRLTATAPEGGYRQTRTLTVVR